MDDFPKIVQRNNYLLKVPNSKGCSEITISLKDSVIYWKLRAGAISDGKFSISNMANIYLVDVNKVMLFVDSICNCMDTRWYWYQNWHQLLHIQMCYVYPVDVKKVTIPTIDESPNCKIESRKNFFEIQEKFEILISKGGREIESSYFSAVEIEISKKDEGREKKFLHILKNRA